MCVVWCGIGHEELTIIRNNNDDDNDCIAYVTTVPPARAQSESAVSKTVSEVTVASLLPSSTSIPGHMTREELERHLDAKQNVFGIEKATASLPMDIFSNDNSNHARFVFWMKLLSTLFFVWMLLLYLLKDI